MLLQRFPTFFFFVFGKSSLHKTKDRSCESCRCWEMFLLVRCWWTISQRRLARNVKSMFSCTSKSHVSLASEMARSRRRSCMQQDFTLPSNIRIFSFLHLFDTLKNVETLYDLNIVLMCSLYSRDVEMMSEKIILKKY